jgi:hypothetical protein
MCRNGGRLSVITSEEREQDRIVCCMDRASSARRHVPAGSRDVESNEAESERTQRWTLCLPYNTYWIDIVHPSAFINLDAWL